MKQKKSYRNKKDPGIILDLLPAIEKTNKMIRAKDIRTKSFQDVAVPYLDSLGILRVQLAT